MQAWRKGAKMKRAARCGAARDLLIEKQRPLQSLGLCRGFHLFLLDFFRLVDQRIGLLQQVSALGRRRCFVRFAAEQEVEVRHGVVIFRAKFQSFAQLFDALID